MSELFPIFLKLRGLDALVVGGGAMAAVRVKQLLKAGARVTVISPEICHEIEDAAGDGPVSLVRRQFESGDLSPGYFLVVGATDNPEVQKAVAAEACFRGQQNLLVPLYPAAAHDWFCCFGHFATFNSIVPS